MNRRLSDRALLMLHEGGGRDDERRHLEHCADCDARYQRLVAELGEIVAILDGPVPVERRMPDIADTNLRWAMAAAILVLAFIGGRLTSGVIGLPRGHQEQALAQSGVASQASQLATAAAFTPASYGLYVDDLMSSEGNGPNPDTAGDDETADADDF